MTGFLLAGVGHVDPTKARENPNFLVVDNSARPPLPLPPAPPPPPPPCRSLPSLQEASCGG